MKDSCLTKDVKRFAIERGARLVGIADAKTLGEISGEKKPFRIIDSARAVVMFAVPPIQVNDKWSSGREI